MEPLLTSVAATVAATLGGKVTESAAAGARAAYDKLAALVRDRFAKEPTADRQLTVAAEAPDDERAVGGLATTLDYLCAVDPDFKRQLEVAWQQVAPHVTDQSGGIVNIISGNVDSAVQIGKVYGDTTVHSPPKD